MLQQFSQVAEAKRAAHTLGSGRQSKLAYIGRAGGRVTDRKGKRLLLLGAACEVDA